MADTPQQPPAQSEQQRRFAEALTRKKGHTGTGAQPHEPGRTITPRSNAKTSRTFRRKSG